MTHKPVENYPGLYKDVNTRAVINKNKDALVAAKKRKLAIIAEKNKVATLEDRVAYLEKMLSQILEGSSNAT